MSISKVIVKRTLKGHGIELYFPEASANRGMILRYITGQFAVINGKLPL